MNHLYQLIHSKNISLVGSATNILDTGLGEKIDDADVIVRVNSNWPSCGCSEYAQTDIGYRSDVLVIDAIEQKDSRKISQILDLKLVIWFHYEENTLEPVRRYLRVMEIPEMKFEEYYDDNDDYYMFVLMLQAILKCKPKSVFLCGITLDSVTNAAIMTEIIKDDRITSDRLNLSGAILI